MMKEQSGSKTMWLVVGGGVLLLAGGATAWVKAGRHESGAAAGVAVPAEYTVEALKKESAEGGSMMSSVREAMNRDDLTDEQRKQIAENMGRVWRERMQANVQEYFAAKTEDDKTAVLDKQLDEMQARMKDFEDRRKESAKDPKAKEREEAMAKQWGPQTQQERKERSESRNPDESAQRMAYFAALRERADSRGIKMPFGGVRGGPGGGGPSMGGGRRGGP